MLLQISEQIRPPPHFAAPDWQALSRQWNEQVERDGARRTKALLIEKSTLTVGIDDKDSEDMNRPFTADHVFGWDNEHGVRQLEVPAFWLAPAPISNLEYLDFLKSHSFSEDLVPTSWSKRGADDYGIRVVFAPGHVDFAVGQHWPVLASAKQLAAYAESKGARLPTEGEIRTWHERFPVDTSQSNVGFRNWHPVPASLGMEQDGKLVGAHNGGAWEWTSTTFEAYDGFSSSILYPGYSSDFFDGTHSVILGGSWATVPRLAGRPSV
jgi:formylglycine-generating enzyme required for sulfatase activity